MAETGVIKETATIGRVGIGIFVKRKFFSDTFKECGKKNTHTRVEMLLCGCFHIVCFIDDRYCDIFFDFQKVDCT